LQSRSVTGFAKQKCHLGCNVSKAFEPVDPTYRRAEKPYGVSVGAGRNNLGFPEVH
jgi:hypothetical protein